MISSGLFVLPAIAYRKAGPAVILSYLLASILVVPSVLSQAELATAMPRAGGTYFFIERSLGSMWGLFGGLANWFSLALKGAFALVGMAVFLELIVAKIAGQHTLLGIKAIAAICCCMFMTLNIVSVKHASRFQVGLVAVLMALLGFFIFYGAGSVDLARFQPFFGDGGRLAVLSTAGMVFVSFGGLTKVASIAEELHNPSRSLPTGMILAWFVVTVLYLGTVAVTVGLLEQQQLAGSLTPISDAAGEFLGTAGFVILGIAAMAAFITTANAGILTASRYPMAMGRDQLAPSILARVNRRFQTPHLSVLLTGGFMIAAIIFLDIESLVKTASTLMIILFMLVNLSVIIMRASRIQSYRPQFRSPLYPYMHIFAIAVYGFLIIDMGLVPLVISACFVALSAAWYMLYVRTRVRRRSALMHIVERVTDTQLKSVTLENELRDILLERDDVIEDRFDHLIRQCEILDVETRSSADEVFLAVSRILTERLKADESVLFDKFRQREAEGGTVIQPGLAIPHIVVAGEKKFDIVLVRAVAGIDFPHADAPVHAMFVLAGSKDERNYHLRALMAIAQIAQEKNFEQRWRDARDIEGIRNLILLSTRKRDTG